MSAEVEVHLRKRYQCSTCGKSWSKETAAKSHIDAGCIKDPDAHACPTCAHEGISDYGWYCDEGLLEEINPDTQKPYIVRRHCQLWKTRERPC